MDDILTWILMGVGILGFELAGRKIWWAWYVNIANQVLWLVFAIITNYWGFVVGTVFYTYQFSRNAYKWTKEHFAEGDRIFEEELAKQPAFVNYFPCGHVSDTWKFACTRPAGHYKLEKSLHAYAGIFWLDGEGSYDHFQGRVVTPIDDIDVDHNAHAFKREVLPHERNDD